MTLFCAIEFQHQKKFSPTNAWYRCVRCRGGLFLIVWYFWMV